MTECDVRWDIDERAIACDIFNREVDQQVHVQNYYVRASWDPKVLELQDETRLFG
jgi:hypothetical protein